VIPLQSRELHDHLRKTPTDLPIAPRIIYVSSARADPRFLPPNPAEDPQLVDTLESYDASKYVAELVTSDLDREFAEEKDGQVVRCLRVDPGVVYTGMFKPFLPLLLEWCMVLTFYVVSLIHSFKKSNR
jgi:3-keto steroid reductase